MMRPDQPDRGWLAEAPSPSQLTVLAVDDSPCELDALEITLRELDCKLVRAKSGAEALRLLLNEEQFALILLDVAMPGMSGFEVADLIRQRPRSSTTPIIFITASLEAQTQAYRGYQTGAVDYLNKPLNPDILRAKVRVFLELAKARKAIADCAQEQQKQILFALDEALKKEEILKREIHHRVKNNLQVIISMLYLQSSQISDPGLKSILLACQERTRSIALIYEMLSKAENLTKIDFIEYLRRLTPDLLEAHQVRSNVVALSIRGEEVFLNVDTALPCGLIIAELVSNSLKHAFPEGRKGEIAISIQRQDPRHLVLAVSDNGVGWEEAAEDGPKSLGLQLVADLVKQLNGTLSTANDLGATTTICFSQND